MQYTSVVFSIANCIIYIITYRAHKLEDIEHKESGGGQSASAKPQTAAANKGSAQKPETDEFKDPDKNIDVCCLARNYALLMQ